MLEPENLNGHEVPEAVPPQEPIPLETADQVVFHMLGWHQNRMGQLLHAMNVPPEIPVEVTDHDTGEIITLNAEQMVGFRAGISIAVSLFQQFPIQMTEAEEEPAPEDQGAADEQPN
jgi:uncharacterized protein involved in propanediol utilization